MEILKSVVKSTPKSNKVVCKNSQTCNFFVLARINIGVKVVVWVKVMFLAFVINQSMKDFTVDKNLFIEGNITIKTRLKKLMTSFVYVCQKTKNMNCTND